MKKNLFLSLMVMALMACSDYNAPSDSSNVHEFSVSDEQQVEFSSGNLQYRASTQTWRFAPNQYDIVGSDNANIADDYDGWIDLFGWGCGDAPTKVTIRFEEYMTYKEFGDNMPSEKKSKKWRTLTKDEWVFLFLKRNKAEELFGLGSVGEVSGLILLPDDWTLPEGVAFTPSTTLGLKYGSHQGRNAFYNNECDNFTHNVYTIDEWRKMETNGAVFLPAAYYRTVEEVSSNVVKDVSYIIAGWYWSATGDDNRKNFAACFDFDNYILEPSVYFKRPHGCSIRLVR